MSVAAAGRHATLRWSGVPLLVTGLVLLLFSVLAVARGLPWSALPHGLLATGLGLAAFGANHDAAISLAWSARRDQQALPEGLSDELDQELERDRAAVLALHASPKVAMAIPLVALGVQLWLLWRLLA